MTWIYKIKRDALGNVERYKSRLLPKEYLQKQGIDFEEVFALVSKHTTLRALLVVVAERDFELHQLDVKTAILNGELKEEIHMQQPQGYKQGGPTCKCVGSLLHMSVCTRPDIAQALGALARHMAGLTEEHWRAALRVVRYLAGISNDGVTFRGSGETLIAYCNAITRVTWTRSGPQRDTLPDIWGGGELVEQAAANGGGLEAENMRAAKAVKEALWFCKLGEDLELDLGTVQIYCDYQGAIRLLKHPIASYRSKHFDEIHHFAWERVARKKVAFAYCKTEDVKADIMTKALAPGNFKMCI
ncbi:hypothetical protein KFL_017460010 [Klebsormidium nitens]|uniref:Reverse transcriptase Ty1/copia-type domain-containing protein n=1 Tax=Klebsormidium nitens TaxID=105231 RepID=A0A1Y1IRY7_KLENI|nr:hypothetical protein KFL_017460010 [Klebsormidium nitens]|eukprot:GAQ93640.1 hypothetical protein KFL_017460010 [Klebsormidium nitens]